MSQTIDQVLDGFITSLLSKADAAGRPLQVTYEAGWESPCHSHPATDGEQVAWRPVRQTQPGSFVEVEKALELKLNAQYCEFFRCYYSENLPATAAQGDCELLQVINPQDFERLQENLIGHVLMKRRLKQPETLFFGLTSDDELILTIDNQTGEVLLERVGKKATEVLAPDLISFIQSLSPRLPE